MGRRGDDVRGLLVAVVECGCVRCDNGGKQSEGGRDGAEENGTFH